MANVNTCTVSGNLTRDPGVRWLTEDGSSAIVNFGLAVNRRRKDKEGEYIEEVSFLDVETFGAFAVLVAKKMRKADAATIQGRLEQQRWEKDGESKSKVVVVAEQIDSEAFFRAAEENATVAVGSTAPATVQDELPAETAVSDAAAVPSADDIPF